VVHTSRNRLDIQKKENYFCPLNAVTNRGGGGTKKEGLCAICNPRTLKGGGPKVRFPDISLQRFVLGGETRVVA